MTTAFLGLGSNLGDKQANLAQAASMLAEAGAIVARSSLWRTGPVGVTDQDWFLNQVLRLETSLSPRTLLAVCLDSERRMGRIRTVRWGPRLIDIDLLLYGEERLESTDLTLPHPRMTERAFVLAPLAELAPGLRLDATSITELLERVRDQDCVRV